MPLSFESIGVYSNQKKNKKPYDPNAIFSSSVRRRKTPLQDPLRNSGWFKDSTKNQHTTPTWCVVWKHQRSKIKFTSRFKGLPRVRDVKQNQENGDFPSLPRPRQRRMASEGRQLISWSCGTGVMAAGEGAKAENHNGYARRKISGQLSRGAASPRPLRRTRVSVVCCPEWVRSDPLTPLSSPGGGGRRP